MDKIEEKIINIIDLNKDKIIEFARDIQNNPELGYKETRTASKVLEIFNETSAVIKDNLAITGVKGYLKEINNSDINVALIGELDAVVSPKNKFANPITGACHACGHHAQLAGVIGAAIALSDEEVKNSLDGNVIFFAVPSEEYGEIEYKLSLKEKGLIKYGGGKSELIRIGEFDDIDISIVHHSNLGDADVIIGDSSSNGFVSKVTRFKGKGAHAAGNPDLGVNALNASAIALNSIAYQRETFRDEDVVRVHSIITKGGGLVNVIPDEVVVESLVRAKTIEAILDANSKVDRSFKAGALAVGGAVKIITAPGYLPVIPIKAPDFLLDVAKNVVKSEKISEIDEHYHSATSTDVGDLTHIMPVIKFATGGVEGQLHSEEFKVINEEVAYIATAKIMALATYRLLKDNCKEAKAIKEKFNAKLTINEYKEYMDNFEKVSVYDYYDEV